MTTISIKRLAKALRERAVEHDNEATKFLNRATAKMLKSYEKDRLGRLAHGYSMRGRECLVIAEGLENGWPPRKAKS